MLWIKVTALTYALTSLSIRKSMWLTCASLARRLTYLSANSLITNLMPVSAEWPSALVKYGVSEFDFLVSDAQWCIEGRVVNCFPKRAFGLIMWLNQWLKYQLPINAQRTALFYLITPASYNLSCPCSILTPSSFLQISLPTPFFFHLSFDSSRPTYVFHLNSWSSHSGKAAVSY